MTFLCLLSCFALLGISSGNGESASLPKLSIRPRIINGQEAQPGTWPWNVVLLNGTQFLTCGGSLISSNWVITAAHCKVTTSSWALVGLHDRRSRYVQKLRVAQVFRHPMFNASTAHNDIALLKLRTGAHFYSKVSHILLPRVNYQFLPSSLCKIVGFGSTDSNGTIYPNTLQEATVIIIDNDRCKNYWDDINLNDILCARRRGVSPAMGDSGGSVVCQKSGVWILAGIISYSLEVAPTNGPFVATRVSAFLPWIEEILTHN